MKSSLLRELAANHFDAVDHGAGEVNHVYAAIKRGCRYLLFLLPDLQDGH